MGQAARLIKEIEVYGESCSYAGGFSTSGTEGRGLVDELGRAGGNP